MTQPSRANAVLPTWGARGNHTANPSGRGPPGRAGRAPRTATRSPRPQQTPQNCPPDRVGLTQHAQLRPQPGRASWEPWGSRGQNQPLPPRALRAGMDPPCRPCGRRGRASRPCVWVDAFLCDRTGLGGGRAHTRATTGHPCPPEDQPWPFEDPRGLAPVPGGLSPSSDTKRPGHRPRGRALCVSVGCAKVSVWGCAGGRLSTCPPRPSLTVPEGTRQALGPGRLLQGVGRPRVSVGQRAQSWPVPAGPCGALSTQPGPRRPAPVRKGVTVLWSSAGSRGRGAGRRPRTRSFSVALGTERFREKSSHVIPGALWAHAVRPPVAGGARGLGCLWGGARRGGTGWRGRGSSPTHGDTEAGALRSPGAAAWPPPCPGAG